MMLGLRRVLVLAALGCVACTGGTSVHYPYFPGQSCSTCWDDLYQGSDPPRPR